MTGRVLWGLLAGSEGLRLLGLAGVPAEAVEIAGFALEADRASGFVLPVARAGAAFAGIRVSGLDAEAAGRVDFVVTALGAGLRADGPGGAVLAHGEGGGEALPEAVALELLAEVLRWQGDIAAERLAQRRRGLAVQAASRCRAGLPPPADLRHDPAPGDVAVARLRHPYAAFFAMEEYDLTWRRFDGAQSVAVTRAVFVSGDAVTVLPYDPARDRVLVVEQFRAGPMARGDRRPWQIEAVAGRVDPGETPEEAARREAVEEAGLALGALIPVARYYPSPGAVSEYLYSYVALADLPDEAAGHFGLEEEAEDIRAHLIGFDRLMELVTSGEVENAPLILTALWLQREKGRLGKAV